MTATAYARANSRGWGWESENKFPQGRKWKIIALICRWEKRIYVPTNVYNDSRSRVLKVFLAAVGFFLVWRFHSQLDVP